MSERLKALAANWGVPLILTIAYLILMSTSDASGIALILMAFGLVIVVLMWVVFRELMLHAALSRAIAMGLPGDVHRLAAPHTRRPRPGRRAPFWIYEALGHDLEGSWQAALDALDQANLRAIPGNARPTWTHLAICTRTSALLGLGRVDEARAIFADGISAAGTGATGELIARITRARVELASGNAAVARQSFEALSRDMRIGPAMRALAHAGAAGAADALGDRDAAAAHHADAARLAPQTWMAKSGA